MTMQLTKNVIMSLKEGVDKAKKDKEGRVLSSGR